MNIAGKYVVLRAIEQRDLPLLHKWSNDPSICSMLGGWHFPSSLQDQDRWFSSLSINSTNQRFAIEIQGTGLVGMANLVDINWKDRNAFHGMLLGDIANRGKGIGTDTIMSISRYAFEELNLTRLDSTIIEYNDPSIHTYTKKCGWTIEGRKKKAYYRGGSYWDQLIIGITKDDYMEHVSSTQYWSDAPK